MQRVVQMRDLVIDPIDRQRVLDQVVGADREEVHALDEQRQGQRGGRDFDHGADRDQRVEFLAGFA